MKVVLFCHSLVSCWSHGNAHFLRGVCRELRRSGHEVSVWEPHDSWSRIHLERLHGPRALGSFSAAYPDLSSRIYDLPTLDLDAALDGADLVLVHEWNDAKLVRRVGEHRLRTRAYRLLFHDTHHRSITAPETMARYDLSGYDGVLAFGEMIRDRYLERGWAARAWVWHEAADTTLFRPLETQEYDGDLLWVGNWGDDERTNALQEFLLEPVRELALSACAYGVRYPTAARAWLRRAGIGYGGWLPNHEVPSTLSRHLMTIHVPRRAYATHVRGIPTIRVFEALACGVPLVCSPWSDSEGLFVAGRDYLLARDGAEMCEHLRLLLADASVRAELGRNGWETILERHTCEHRVRELIGIHDELTPSAAVA